MAALRGPIGTMPARQDTRPAQRPEDEAGWMRMPEPLLRCPECGKKGRRVGLVTLRALLKPELQSRIGEVQYRFCAQPACQTVYYAEDGAPSFVRSDLSVRVGVKETRAPRPVCYCFDHTIEEIDEQVRRTGSSTVLDDIETRMKVACWCETKNPRGSCCLGDVSRAIRECEARHGRALPAGAEAAPVEVQESGKPAAHAFPAEPAGVVAGRAGKRPGSWSTARALQLGALLSAVVGSACCWLPLLLLVFGFSGVAVSAVFEQYRPIFMTLTLGMLAAAFYLTYRPRHTPAGASGGTRGACAVVDGPAEAEESCCPLPGTALSRLQRWNRLMLWIVAPVALAFVFFPSYVGLLLGSGTASAYSSGVDLGQLGRRRLAIKGMTCQGCAAHLQAELAKLPGVRSAEVRYEEKRALVVAEPAVSEESLVRAVERVGYRARPLAGETASTPGE